AVAHPGNGNLAGRGATAAWGLGASPLGLADRMVGALHVGDCYQHCPEVEAVGA
nr:hypothetical protein [Tanacetum cinerariifolium]